MVESLKRSVARLQPPLCPHCSLQMIWYRSVRAADEHDRIIHYFQCANCNRIEEKSTKIKTDGNGEGPLTAASRPRRPRVVAASRHGARAYPS